MAGPARAALVLLVFSATVLAQDEVILFLTHLSQKLLKTSIQPTSSTYATTSGSRTPRGEDEANLWMAYDFAHSMLLLKSRSALL